MHFKRNTFVLYSASVEELAECLILNELQYSDFSESPNTCDDAKYLTFIKQYRPISGKYLT
jgi:hypothetical protein